MTDTTHRSSLPDQQPTQGNMLATFAQHMVGFAERWFPDAYVFVLIAVVVVAIGTMVHGGSPLAVSRAFGDGFWNLIPFTMQMALVAIGGYVVAMSPPVAAALRRLAGFQPPHGAPWFLSAC
jgi:short-chain fatty acids transporter